MFTLGIPNRQYRRATQVLGPENAYPIEYDAVDQGDGFYVFSFDLDYDGFQDIVMMLKHNGITTIGADSQLTERNIMKLTDLLEEQPLSDMVEDFYENQSMDRPDTNIDELKIRKLIRKIIRE